MSEFNMFTGEQVRAGRAISRIEQAALAERCGLSLETIKRIEAIHGVAEVNSRTYGAIVRAFAELGVEFEFYDGAGYGVRRSDWNGAARVGSRHGSPVGDGTRAPRAAREGSGRPSKALQDNRPPVVRQRDEGQPGSSDMMSYWDNALICRFANEAYFEWFGMRPDQLVGLPMPRLLGAELFAMHERFALGALAGESQVFERTLKRPNGEVGHTLVYFTPDRDRAGRVVGFRALLLDVTALKEAELNLARANAVFEEARRRVDAAALASVETLARLTAEFTG